MNTARTLALLAALSLVGCPGRRGPRRSAETLVLDQDEVAGAAGVPVEPGPWREEGGLRLTVPAGWSGRTGPEDSSLLLTLVHDRTGVAVELWVFQATGEVEIRPRPHCEWVFADDASHRAIPVLAPATIATCTSGEPGAPLVQGWFGLVGDREVHVEVVFPHGRVIEGRQAVEPLLATLGWR